MAEELSTRKVESILAAGEKGVYADGKVKGLYLSVSKWGTASWTLRFMRNGKAREKGLGAYPLVPLALARDWARAARQLLAQGIDPIQAHRELKAAGTPVRTIPTFAKCVDDYLKNKGAEWRSLTHTKQFEATLKKYAEPIWGKPVDQIIRADVLECIEAEWAIKTQTMSRVRNRIELVLKYAEGKELRDGPNPAMWRGGLDAVLPKPSKVAKVVHHPAVPYQQINAFLTKLRGTEGLNARCLELVVLTGVRSGEARGARWPEFDLHAATWTIPGERTKSGRPFKVPLSTQAVALLRRLPEFGDTDLVFPNSKAEQLNDNRISEVMRALEPGMTVHGFRSSLRDFLGEQTDTPHEVCEMCLAHAVGDGTVRAYARSDLFEKRRVAMQLWGDHCDREVVQATVTPISSKARKAKAAA